jgi:hypothetical protein
MTELHGGKLEIESAPDRGTTARACFPAARIVGIADIIPAAAAGAAGTTPSAALEQPARRQA